MKKGQDIQEKPTKNKFGQYFTPEIVADFMISLANVGHKARVLEPTCGAGIFLKQLQQQGFSNVTAYEIDSSLATGFSNVKYESFVSANIQPQFDLVIGNPPYIRWKNLEPELKDELAGNHLWQTYCNSLCDYLYIFILKSIEALKNEGQLIFICPEYWLNTTHSLGLRNYMMRHGYFEKIYHLNETPIFNNASVSVIIFKYVKSTSHTRPEIEVAKYYKSRAMTKEVLDALTDPTEQNQDIERFKVRQFEVNERWLLAKPTDMAVIQVFEEACAQVPATIGDVCHIANGMVSGLDKAFQLAPAQLLTEKEQASTLKVIKGKHLTQYGYNTVTDYIFANDVATEICLKAEYPHFFARLQVYKNKLEKRYQYNRVIPYWHWAFLRSYKLFSSATPRIFVPCKERISNKKYFRFSLVPEGIYPTQDVTALFLKEGVRESIYYILAFLNNQRAFTWLSNKGIIKGNIVEFSEKPLASLPFRKIDWKNSQEAYIHKQIVIHSKACVMSPTEVHLKKLDKLFNELYAV